MLFFLQYAQQRRLKKVKRHRAQIHHSTRLLTKVLLAWKQHHIQWNFVMVEANAKIAEKNQQTLRYWVICTLRSTSVNATLS